MSTITIELPDEVLKTLSLEPDEMAKEIRISAAIKLFELKRLSSGVAAMLAGISRVAFLARLAEYGVDTFDLTEEDLLKETRLV